MCMTERSPDRRRLRYKYSLIVTELFRIVFPIRNYSVAFGVFFTRPNLAENEFYDERLLQPMSL